MQDDADPFLVLLLPGSQIVRKNRASRFTAIPYLLCFWMTLCLVQLWLFSRRSALTKLLFCLLRAKSSTFTGGRDGFGTESTRRFESRRRRTMWPFDSNREARYQRYANAWDQG